MDQIPAVRMEGKRRRSSAGGLYGLENQGSTCYLNSVLQVLYWTIEYREAVRSSKDFNFIDVELARLFEELKERTGTTVNVTRKLGIQRVNQQQDSAEHFEKILMLSSPEASKVFRGSLEHKTVCNGCHRETGAEGNFWHLPLPLVNSHSEDFSVIEGMEEFFRSSDFSGDNQVYCDACDRKQDATVACEMTRFPAVLTLLLKRFEFSYKYMSYIKNNCAVDVPYVLNIPEVEGRRYELFAFIDHSGSLKSGHYTATIKCQHDNNQRWFTFNDSYVYQHKSNQHQVENDNGMANSQSAYLLFYQRKTHPNKENLRDLKMDNAENEEQIHGNKRVKREGEGGVMKGEEHVNMEDRKRKTAFNKSQVEGSVKVIAERNDVAEAQRGEKEENDGKTNREMLTNPEGERKERLGVEDRDRNREFTRQERDNPKINPTFIDAQVQEEKRDRRNEFPPEKPNSRRSSGEDRVIKERNDVVEVQREDEHRKTNREMLKNPENERKERLGVEDRDRNREFTRQGRNNPKINPTFQDTRVQEEKRDRRKEFPPEKPDRRRSSGEDRVIKERIDVQRGDEVRKTNREMFRSQEDQSKERLEMEDYDRINKMRRQERDIQKSNVKEAQVHVEKLPRKPDRRWSSDPTEASPGLKRPESKDQDESQPLRKTEKLERKMVQDPADELEPLQEDIDNPSDSCSESSATQKKQKKCLPFKCKKYKKDKKDKKVKKDKPKKGQKNGWLSCMSSSTDD